MRRWYGKVPSSFDREANGCCVIMKCMKKGLFITFEGPDGSGKTTVSTAVVVRLQKEGYQVRYTREPGGSKIAEEIRDVILDPKNTEMDPRCEALLYWRYKRSTFQYCKAQRR